MICGDNNFATTTAYNTNEKSTVTFDDTSDLSGYSYWISCCFLIEIKLWVVTDSPVFCKSNRHPFLSQ